MKIEITEVNGVGVAHVISETTIISSTQDALDIMMDCSYQGADSLILHEDNLTPDFFELSTGVAGDILQKFSTYNCRLAIIGNFEDVESKSLSAFIAESNRMGRIHFVASLEDAKEVLAPSKKE